MFTSFMNVLRTRNKPPKKKRKVAVDDANLVWTDEEIQLLLEVIRDFKAAQLYEGIDWDISEGKV